MANYNYTRSFADGKWDINNPCDVDGNNIPVPLAERIAGNIDIGAKLVSVHLSNNTAVVTMNQGLTAQEEATLDTIVSDHKSASGTEDYTSYIELTSANNTNFLLFVDNSGQLQVQQD